MSFEIFFLILATIGFVIFMGRRTVLTVMDENSAIFSLAYVLDSVRYTIMFLSFLATQILGYIAVNNILDNYDMPTNFSIIVNVIVFFATVLISALITTSIVQSERAIGEGNFNLKQLLTILIILGSMSVLDYNSLKEGATQLYKQIEQYKIKEIKQVDNLTAITLNSNIELLRQKQKELKELNTLIEYSDDKEGIKLFSKRDRINRDIERITNKITILNRRLKAEQEREINNLKKDNREALNKISQVVIGLMLLAFLVSVARSILLEDYIVKPQKQTTQDVENNTNDEEKEDKKEIRLSKSELQQKYVIEAMKQYADDKGYILGEYESLYHLKFPRDTIIELAKRKALKDNIILELGASTAQRIIKNSEIQEIVADYIRDKSINLDAA
jgi:hypothetical protein